MAEDQSPVQTEDVDQAGEAGDKPQERKPLSVTVTDIGPARKRLTLEIPPERISETIGSTYDKLQDDAVIPGFRRGRAPRRLLERRFDDSVRKDVRGQLLSECYTQAIDEQKLDVIGEPEIKDVDKIELPEEGSLTVECEVEVAPDVVLPDLSGTKIFKPSVEVTDEVVERELDRYRERFGEAQEVGEGELASGDYAQADVRVLSGEDAGDDAEIIATHDNIYIHVPGEATEGKGHVAGIIVADLADRLVGKSIGEVVAISMKGPSGHENEKIRDQPVTLRIKIDRAQRITAAEVEKLPEILGVASVEDLRQQLRDAQAAKQLREQSAAMQRQVCEQLLEKVDLELPEGVTGRQAERMLRREAMAMAYRGMAPQDIDQRIAEMRDESHEEARKQLKLFFILDKAARDMEVEVTEGELNGRIAMMALQHGRRPEKLRQQMQRNGEIESLYISMREQKTLDRLLEKCEVVEGDLPEEDTDKPAAKKKTTKKKTSKKKAAKKKDDTGGDDEAGE